MRSDRKKKKKKSGGVLFWLIIVVLVGVMGFSGYKIWTIKSAYHAAEKNYEDIAKIAGADIAAEDLAGAVGKAGQDQEDEKLRMKYLNLNWQDLQAVSDDIIGWIRLPKTVINYPIVQGSDNDFYLTHTASGEWSNNGAIFADANDPNPLGGFLTILYGHRMRDWSMFGSIGDYFDDHGDSDYFQQHPVWQVYTPDKTYDLEIFGAAEVHSENTDIYRFYFADEDDRQSYIDWILAHNELQGYDGRVSVTPDDKLIMLSTCTLASNEYRLVVWGKLTEVEVPKP